MSMFNDISCDRKGNKDECLANAEVVKVLARRFGVGQWSFIGPGSEKKWYSAENSPQGAWDNIAEEMLLEFAESGHPTFRATTPLSRGILKSKGRGKLSFHFAADEHTIDTIFRIILSVNQLSVYGAVANICEEFENHQDGSGEPDVLMGQSIVLRKIKTEVFKKIEESPRPLCMVEDLNDDEIIELCILSNELNACETHSNTQSVEVCVICSGFDNCKSQRNNVGPHQP